MSGKAPVSVVIPCYRCTRTIERALASVAAQTMLPAEVVLVDDGSGDGTKALLQQLSKKYEPGWVKLVLLDQNVGAGSARNAGWAVATQPLIAFLDADDAWHRSKIEIQCGFMTANPDIALSGHGFNLLDPGQLPDWEADKGTEQYIGKWRMMLSNPFVTPSVMVRSNVPCRFVEHQRYMEDHMLWLNVVCTGALVVKLPTALAAIYKAPYGVTGLSSRIWLMERSDLGNYRRLYQAGFLNGLQFALLTAYSMLKHLRRLVIYTVYLRWKK